MACFYQLSNSSFDGQSLERREHSCRSSPIDLQVCRGLYSSVRPGIGRVRGYQLGERLRRLGLRPGQARSTALFQLATELPAALLARMLGIHIAVAVAWQRASSGDWTG